MKNIKDNFKVNANKSKKHFTIFKNSSKYRTCTLTKEEFEELDNNTQKDWEHFLITEDFYYLIK
jgi:hypothetical protein